MTSEKTRKETRKVLILHSPWPHIHVLVGEQGPHLGEITEFRSSEFRGKAGVVPLGNVSKGEELGRVYSVGEKKPHVALTTRSNAL